MERLQLAAAPTDSAGFAQQQQQAAGNNIVEFLAGVSYVILPAIDATVTDNDDSNVNHRVPSYYDQSLVGDLASMQQHHEAINNGSDFAWMKDKKVSRKNNHHRNYIHILLI